MVTWRLWMVIAPDCMPQHQVPPASITAEGKGVKGEEKVHLWHWSRAQPDAAGCLLHYL